MSATDQRRRSDRECAGLRGPVKNVVEGSTRWEYDREGRVVSCRWLAQPDSEASAAVETWTYDNSGRLLSKVVRSADGSVKEKKYSYDEQGRLLRIAENNGDRRSFEYDQEGRKTEIREIMRRAEQPRGAIATGIDVVFADVEGTLDLGFNGSGNANRIKTIYDENNHPTETQAFSGGHLLSRIVRTFDDQHRVTDVRVIVEDPSSMFQGMAGKLMKLGGFLLEGMDQLKRAISPMMESGRSHTYDSQGRRTKTVLRQGAMGETSRTYSYNDYGDVIEERTTFMNNRTLPIGVPFHLDETGNAVTDQPPSEWPTQSPLPESSVVRYDYEYDSNGNWTEKRVTYSEQSRRTERREVTYH